MTQFSYYVICLAILTIPLSTTVAGSAWTLLVVPGGYYFALHLKRNGIRHFWKTRSHLLLMLFILSILFSNLMNLAVHSDPFTGFKKTRYLIVCFLNVYTLDHLIKTIGSKKQKAKLLADLMIYGFTVGTIYAYISYFAKYDFIKMVPEDLGGRVTGITGIMEYGYQTPIVVLFCLSVGFYFSSKEKIGLGIINALGVIFSGTRGGIVSLIGGLPLWVYYHFRRFFTGFLIGAAAVTAAVIICFVALDVDLERLSGKRNLSNLLRLKAAELSFVAFKDSPFYGHGLLSQKEQYPVTVFFDGKYVTPYGGLQICESTYLQILVDVGAAGLVLYLVFLFCTN